MRLPMVINVGAAVAVAFVTSVHADTFPVTTTAESGPGSLKQAILDANACSGANIIDFAPSAYGRILLTSGELLISDHLFINGPAATNLAVDGNAAGRVFHIASGNSVTIAGLTITNGLANSNSGGGIYNDHAALTISNCAISGNSSIGAAGGVGGGIFSDGQAGGASLKIFMIIITLHYPKILTQN